MSVTRLNTRMAPTKNGKQPIVYLATHPTDRRWQEKFKEEIGDATGACMKGDDGPDEGDSIKEVWEAAEKCTPSKGEKSWADEV